MTRNRTALLQVLGVAAFAGMASQAGRMSNAMGLPRVVQLGAFAVNRDPPFAVGMLALAIVSLMLVVPYPQHRLGSLPPPAG